jgi:hypothetical protein
MLRLRRRVLLGDGDGGLVAFLIIKMRHCKSLRLRRPTNGSRFTSRQNHNCHVSVCSSLPFYPSLLQPIVFIRPIALTIEFPARKDLAFGRLEALHAMALLL